MFKWKKLGLVFSANGQYDWMNSYTTPAAAIVLDSCIRVFITTRSKLDNNGNFISYSSFIDVDKTNPTKVIYVHNKYIIDLGEPGAFDEYGIMVAKPIVFDEKLYLYYMGWQRLSGESIPYQVMLGLAISNDNGFTFTKISKGPIIGIDYYDPFSIGNVSVLIENGLWRMWYTTYTRWAIGGQKPTPVYNIKYAYSIDGIFWTKSNMVAIDEDESGGVATPMVIKLNGMYHMWFGFRPPFDKNGKISGYKIGYAFSKDGIKWVRDDNQSGIYVSQTGWDSEMVCYPHIIEVDGRILMFYSGNHFGRDGFGVAELIN
jgi:hypothetical protein